MMSEVLYIDDLLIQNSDIELLPSSVQGATLKSQLLADSMDIVLNNIDNGFSKFNPSSIFYGQKWYGRNIRLYDTENEVDTWHGSIKNIEQDDNNKTIKIISKNFVRDLADTKLEYISTTETTLAEHIYIILTEKINYDKNKINYASFQKCINIQIENNIFADINYVKKDNKKALTIINELLKIGSMTIAFFNDKINLYQWEIYCGSLGYRIDKSNILAGTFKTKNLDNVINDYKIAYKTGSTVSYQETDFDDSILLNDSIKKYGIRTEVIPNKEIDVSDVSKFKILLQNSIGAKWCGNNIINKNLASIIEYKINLSGDYSFLRIHDQIDFNEIAGMTLNPTRIKSLKHDRDNKVLNVSGEFINFPIQVFNLDVISPSIVEFYYCFAYTDGTVVLKWKEVDDTDLAGYKIYFANDPGQWNVSTCNKGQSPITSQTHALIDGYNTLILHGFDLGMLYYFKITAIDKNFNESAFSNVLTCTPDVIGIENFYYTKGYAFTEIDLDSTNSYDGVSPGLGSLFDSARFDNAVFDVGVPSLAAYQSSVLTKSEGWNFIKLYGEGVIKYQHREIINGTPQAWTAQEVISGDFNKSLTGLVNFQFRILFFSATLFENDYFIIYEIR